MTAPAPNSGLNLNGGAGAVVDTLYVRREVKAYALHESDVELLGHLGFQASSFFAAASFFAALALGILTNASFVTGEMPATGLVLRNFGVPLLLFVAVVCGLMAFQALRKRGRKWKDIKEASGPA
tara:strand:- start:1672 stop:2046 length:375 start_codon:yes stop_codon:yes gene_type:complete